MEVSVRIMRDSSVVKADKYKLNGPVFTNTLQPPAFIDCQRYALEPGDYHVEIDVTDHYSELKKPLQIRSEVPVFAPAAGLYGSFIQPLEGFSKTAAPGPLTRSGYDLLPFNSDLYPESSKLLAFYYELYNAAKVFGVDKSFVLGWHIETADDSLVLSAYTGFRKEKAQPVNVLLARTDISTLGSGDYALVISVKDEAGATRLKEKYYFRRQNRMAEVQSLTKMSKAELTAAFVGNTRNADTLQMYVECLWPIGDNVDKERIVNQSVRKDVDSLRWFVVDFWQRRAADTGNPLKMWGSYYKSVQEAMALFRCGKQKGYYTERGRVYLQYGRPSARAEQPNEPNTFPYEIWTYYLITDQVNGQFFSNRKFVFVNKNLGDDCHTLIHSDMRGEIYNPRWQFEVTRRNYEGIENPDREAPPNIQNNQFNEIYRDAR